LEFKRQLTLAEDTFDTVYQRLLRSGDEQVDLATVTV
jgi:hypothetical protein